LGVFFVWVTVGERAGGRRAEARREARVEPLRPQLMALAVAEDDELEQAIAPLLALDEPTWRAVAPSVVALLPKLRGDTHDCVVSVLTRRGVLARAERDTRHRSALRRAHGAHLLGVTGVDVALPRLLHLLDDEDAQVRQIAARGLGSFADPVAADALLGAVVGRRGLPPRVVADAVLRIGAVAHPAIVRALTSPEPVRRSVAADIAGLTGAHAATEALIQMLTGDPVRALRPRAARALGRLGMPAAAPALRQGLTSSDPALVIASAEGLGGLGDPASVAAVADVARRPALEVARAACRSLTEHGPAGMAALLTLAVQDVPMAHETIRAIALREGARIERLPAPRRTAPRPAAPPVPAPAARTLDLRTGTGAP
jgi:HEAT repeat protein